MNISIAISIGRALVVAAVWSCSFSANAQRVLGNEENEAVATQLARVKTAMQRLAPFQLASCWLSPRVLPLIGLTAPEGKGPQASPVVDLMGVSTPLTLVQSGDVLVSIDDEAIKSSGAGAKDTAESLRTSRFQQLNRSGRTFVETYRNSKDELVSVANPVRLDCRASDMYISETSTKYAASRNDFFGLSISASRLALLDDEQLLAFLAWNHAFMALRSETYADFMSILASSRYQKQDYVYGSGTHEKIDWVTLTSLRSMNAKLNAYGTMISVVGAFDKSVGFSFGGDKRWIAQNSGGSPFGDEAKQSRLAAWVKLLEQDAQAPVPSSLSFSNAVLASPTWSTRTLALTNYQTVGEALLPLLGAAQAKAVAEEYISNFDPNKAAAAIVQMGGAKRPPFQMLYAHHPTQRLIWLAESVHSSGDGAVCMRPSDCSLIAVGPNVVARPSETWAQELKAEAGTLKLEKVGKRH